MDSDRELFNDIWRAHMFRECKTLEDFVEARVMVEKTRSIGYVGGKFDLMKGAKKYFDFYFVENKETRCAYWIRNEVVNGRKKIYRLFPVKREAGEYTIKKYLRRCTRLAKKLGYTPCEFSANDYTADEVLEMVANGTLADFKTEVSETELNALASLRKTMPSD